MILCLSFAMPAKINEQAIAVDHEISNIMPIELNADLTNSKREQNKSLIDTSVGSAFEGYVYSPKSDSNGNNYTMTFTFAETEINDLKSLYDLYKRKVCL